MTWEPGEKKTYFFYHVIFSYLLNLAIYKYITYSKQ